MSTGTNTPRAYFAGLWRPSKEAPKGANRWLRCDGFECNRTLERGQKLVQAFSRPLFCKRPTLCQLFVLFFGPLADARLLSRRISFLLWKRSGQRGKRAG